MFYAFRQNNSGGVWKAPAIAVVVEADSAGEANRLAESNGLYFNGVRDGRDCECCGDRWFRQHYDEGDQVPTVWDEVINLDESYSGDKYGLNFGREANLPNFLVIYKDGTQKLVK